MMADPAALQGSPFPDWRLPGVLLATLVGGGFLAATYSTAEPGDARP